jgi:FkbM family methyltransferase
VTLYRLARHGYQRSLNRGYWRYREARRDLYRRFIRLGDLVFDIGACHGRVTDILLDCGCQVVAVEPNPVQAALIRKRYGVTVVEAALSDIEGTAMLSVGADPAHSTINDEWKARAPTQDRWVEEIKVRVTTLAALEVQFGPPAFVKIDVEGNDAKVVAGAGTAPSALSFEYQASYPDVAREAIELLAGHRFAFTRFQGTDLSGWHDRAGALAWLECFTDKHPDGYGDAFACA